MTTWLINFVYATLLAMGMPWVVYRVIWLKKNRRGWLQRLFGLIPTRNNENQCLWLHAVSVGEVQLLGPIVDELRNRFSNVEFAISTTTEAGFDVATKRFPNQLVFFSPLDFSWAIHNVLRRLRPKAIVLVELELWPNLLRLAERSHTPVMVINGRLSDRSFKRYKWIAPVIRRMLRSVNCIAAQSSQYAERFLALGARPETVSISGNIKFDGAFNPAHRDLGQQLKKKFQIGENEILFVAGSTQPEEDAMVVEAFQNLSQNYSSLRLVVVPRHLNNLEALLGVLSKKGMNFVRQTAFKDQPSNSESSVRLAGKPPVIVVDVMGELASWWSLADIAYVGGSMGRRGGQNMIEPAANRAAVSFGSRTENFRDVVSLLLRNDAAVVINNQRELESFLEKCLLEPEWRNAIGSRAHDVVQSQQGATARTCDLIRELLQPQSSPVAKRSNRAA